MYIQAWDTRDGSPHLFFDNSDMTDNMTMIRPPEGIYQPFYFDIEKQEWIGTTPSHDKNDSEQEECGNKEEDGDEEEVRDGMEEQVAHLMFENSQLKLSAQEAEEEMAGMLFFIVEMMEKSNKEESSEGDVEDDTEIPNV